MKNKMRVTHFSFFFLLLTTVVVSCVKKDDMYKENSDESARKTVVQIIGADELIQFARDVKPTNDTFILIDVRRYPNNEAGLNEPLTVKLESNPTLIDDYDSTNGTSYVEMPAGSYTLLDDINAITFQPGEAIKTIRISVDQTKLDLSQQYALGFSIADPGSNAVANTTLENALYNIGVKNKYDGHYLLTGTMVDAANSALTGAAPIEVDLETVGASSVILNPTQGPFAYGYLYPILNAGAGSGYGSFTPIFNFDANDNIVSVENAYGQPAGNGRSAEIDPSGLNRFNADRSIDVKYWMNQPSVIAGHRSSMDEHYQYIGPR